jgi:hypothetical protein
LPRLKGKKQKMRLLTLPCLYYLPECNDWRTPQDIFIMLCFQKFY